MRGFLAWEKIAEAIDELRATLAFRRWQLLQSKARDFNRAAEQARIKYDAIEQQILKARKGAP